MEYADEIVIDTNGYLLSFYDIDRIPLITQLKKQPDWSNTTWIDDGVLYVRHTLATYYLGISSIVVAKKIDTAMIVRKISTLFIPLIFIMAAVGWFLSRIAFRPALRAFEAIDTFVKHATHDLNTPIAAILSNARILEEKISEASLSRFVQRITIGAKTLTGLYDDLVYLNFQSRQQKSKEEPIDVLVKEQLSLLKTLIEYKEISLKTELDEVTLRIYADDFSRLINNLLTNAIKYNMPKGSISITLTSNYLSIKDSGIGLSQEDIQKIYKRYWRAESFEVGLGIGMEIVIRVCKIYNLTLDIESSKNEGSEFIIRWPKSLIV